MTKRQSFFSSDLGVSGVYEESDGVMFNPIQENSENKELETIPKESPMDLAESGTYTSRIESPYQVGRDLNRTLLSPRAETEQVVESGRNTPDRGLYSRKIESIRTEKEEIDKSISRQTFYPFKTYWLPEDKGIGIYDSRINSLDESNGPDCRRSINSREENLKMSRKSRPFDRLGATTLSTMSEEDEQILCDRDRPDLGYSRPDVFPKTRVDNDNLSNSSEEKNGEPPNWTDIILNPGFNEAYLRKAWPRISLHLQHKHRPSDPFVAVSDENLNIEQQRNYSRFLVCFLWWSFVILAITATILAVFLLRTKDDEPKALKEYVKLDMNMTVVDKVYLTAYDTPTSSEYKSFTEEFCTEVGKAYQSNNSTQFSYFGCQITELSPGSIIVIFTVYYTDTSVIIVNENAGSVIVSHIQLNSNKLGQFVISVNTIDIKDATIITAEKPPEVLGKPLQTTSSVTDLTTTRTIIPRTSADTRQTTAANDIITTNAILTTKMTVATTNIADKTEADSGSTIFVSKLTTIVTETNLQGTESTTYVNQSSKSTEHSTTTIDTTVTHLSTDGTEHMTSTSVPNPTIPNEQTTTDAEPTTVPVPTAQTVQTTTVTEPTTVPVPTVPNEQTTTDTETTSKVPGPTVPTLRFTMDAEPTATVPDSTVPNEKKTTDTEPTTTVPSPTVPTVQTTTDTEQTATAPGPTVQNEQTTTDTEPTSTVPDPTVLTVQTTVTESTVTIPDPTIPNEQTTTDTVPTTVPDQTQPDVLTTTETEQKTTVHGPTVPIEQLTTDSAQTTTEPDPTVPTVQTITVTEPTKVTVPTGPTEQTGSITTITELTTSVPELTTPITEVTTSVTDSITLVTDSKTSVTELITSVTDSITLKTNLKTNSRADSTISTVETTTKSNDTISLLCPISKTLQLYESSGELSCSVSNPQAYNYFQVYHEGGKMNSASVFDVKYHKNGTIFESYQTDIGISGVSTDTHLMIRFENVSCLIDGTFSVVLLQDTETVAKSELIITVEGMPQKPFITLNTDQVVDLVFPDGNFYRADRIHKCEGNTGLPAANLEIDITYDNGTTFQPIPTDQSTIVSRTNVSSNCVTVETLKFALLFTEDMHKARLRCKTAGDNTVETLSEELLLIPRNICNCGENKDKRGHPFDCNAYVECIKDSSGIYPLGIGCHVSECRDSITGLCSTNCSSAVCDETVPPDFCPLPTVPTTTEPPSPYVSCQGETIEVTAGSAEITCTLNGTAFSLLNITSRSSTDGVKTVIIQIDNAGNSMDMISSDGVIASLNGDLVSISIASPSCIIGDFYGVDVIVDDIVVGSSSGKLIVGNTPKEAPILKLHPDQIADTPYRNWLLHSCYGDIGFPGGDLVVEILEETDSDFRPLAISIKSSNTNPLENCTVRKEIKFGISFTTDMKNAVIRCGVTNKNFANYTTSYSNNGSVSLIPMETCQSNNESLTLLPHPSDCTSFVQCEVTTTYGLPCPQGLCFGIEETNACDSCNRVTCLSEVSTTLMTTQGTTTDTVSSEVSCTGSVIEINTGATEITCKLNSSTFSFLNITYMESKDAVPKVIFQIDHTGIPTDLMLSDGVTAILNGELVYISIESPTCTTGDFYGVDFIFNGSVVGSSEGKLVVESRPKNSPSFYLHPDQIPGLETYRSESLHSCNADIGFPAGDLFVEILRTKDTDFMPLTISILTSNTSQLNACSYGKEIKFGITFTTDMNAAFIRCGVKNERLDNFTSIYSKNLSVALIPKETCENNTGRIYKPHPTDCNSFVQCEGTSTYGKPCPSDQCFGIESVNYCDHCDRLTCLADITSISTATPATSTEKHFGGLKCEDMSTLIFSENVDLVCFLNQTTAFDTINITFISSSDNSVTVGVAVIVSPNSIPNPADQDVNFEVQYTDGSLTITVKNVSCEYDGTFYVNVYMGDSSFDDSIRLSVLAKPSGMAALTMNADQVINLDSDRPNKEHVCQADVGNPPGEIFVELRLEGEDSYQNISNLNSKGEIDTFLQCSVKRELKFLVDFTSEMDNATIRCRVVNDNYPSFSPITSNTDQLALIQGDFCVGKNGTFFSHTSRCKRFVQCVFGSPNVQECPNNLCYKQSTTACDTCDIDCL